MPKVEVKIFRQDLRFERELDGGQGPDFVVQLRRAGGFFYTLKMLVCVESKFHIKFFYNLRMPLSS